MNGETKHYLKAVGVCWNDRAKCWLLAGAEKTSTGPKLLGFASVSDGMAFVSAAEKLLSARLDNEENPVMVSVAADAAQMGFYPFTVPVVEGARQDALIAAQAEASIPMPLPQTTFTWRITRKEAAVGHGFLCVVRKGYYQELMALAPGRVGSVLPDATALVRAWTVMYESSPQPAVLIQIRRCHCIVALCEREKLVRAAAADWEGPSAIATLISDLSGLMESLQVAASTPIYITGPAVEAKQLCDALNAAAKPASLWQISENKIHAIEPAAAASEITDCPQAVGLALAALDEEPSEFDFIRRPKAQTEAVIEWDKKLLIRSLAIAVVVLVLFLAVSYRSAQKEIRAIRQALSAEHQDTTGDKIIARQQMRERIAKARPDMQELLTILNTCAGNEITLDSFSFKKGQNVRIVGKTESFERVYAFQKKLQENSGISDVKLISPTKDDKKRQVQFTMTFAYRNFSR